MNKIVKNFTQNGTKFCIFCKIIRKTASILMNCLYFIKNIFTTKNFKQGA